MLSKRILVAILAVALLSFPALGAEQKKQETKNAQPKQAATAAQPTLTLVEPLKDFGTIPRGEKINWDFAVKNTGKAELQILSAQPSCGCTVANFDKVIKPGDVGKVSAHIDTSAFSGPISKTITIQTNDPNTPAAQLTLNAIVKPYVEASPSGFVRFNMVQGDVATQTVTLYSEEDEPFQITGVDVPGEWVKVDYKKIENEADRVKVGKTGQNQYKVDVTYGGPTAKVGLIAEKLHIKTNSKHQPEFVLNVTGLIRPTFAVSPTVLNFGEVAPAEPAALRTLSVRSNDAKAPQLFKVTKIESSLPEISTDVKPTDKPGEFLVTAAVAAGAKEGAIDGTLKIYTNDQLNPFVIVPVKGKVKSAAPVK